MKHCCVFGSGLPSPTPASPDEKRRDTPREPARSITRVSADDIVWGTRLTEDRKFLANTDCVALGHWKRGTSTCVVYKQYNTTVPGRIKYECGDYCYLTARHRCSSSRWSAVWPRWVDSRYIATTIKIPRILVSALPRDKRHNLRSRKAHSC